jgi:TRAP-type C4-dicarboxylate transport system permease large subunit
MTATVCFLLGTAAVVAWILTVGQVPAFLVKIMRELSAGPTAFLLFSALLFIILGAVIEGPAAVVILLPTFLPVVKQFGIDLIHYSIVITAAVGIGLFLPPIGVGLFIACGIAKISMDRALGPMLPYVIFLCLGLLIVILLPWFTLILPRLLGL